MRNKEFYRHEVESKLKEVLAVWRSKKLGGKSNVELTDVIGNYQFNSMNRHIKEVIFFRATNPDWKKAWYLRYPRKNVKELADIIMNSKNVTKSGSYMPRFYNN